MILQLYLRRATNTCASSQTQSPSLIMCILSRRPDVICLWFSSSMSIFKIAWLHPENHYGTFWKNSSWFCLRDRHWLTRTIKQITCFVISGWVQNKIDIGSYYKYISLANKISLTNKQVQCFIELVELYNKRYFQVANTYHSVQGSGMTWNYKDMTSENNFFLK